MFLSVVLSIVILFLIIIGKKLFTQYWKNVGVPCLGLINKCYVQALIGRKPVCDAIVESYLSKPEEKVVGFYFLGNPSLILRDPELIRQLYVKDFEHFIDRFPSKFISEKNEPYLCNSVVLAHGEKWKRIRTTLNPAFTSAKMKGMVAMITKCGKQMVDYYDSMIIEKQSSHVDVELKNMATCFSTDVIASTVFGLESNTFDNLNNTFAKVGKEFTTISVWRGIKNLFIPMWLKKRLNFHVYSEELMGYFRNTLNETIAIREKNKIVRLDLINLLIEAMGETLKNENNNSQVNNKECSDCEDSLSGNNKKTPLTLDEATIQALTFLMAGYESVSTVFSLGLYEITMNKIIKQKLESEIDTILKANDGLLTYDIIKEMTYLDMVVSETLRKYPPTWITDRLCVKNYSFDVDDKTVFVKKNMPVYIFILGMHRDPKYYPNPDKFDPERFNSENKEKILPYTYFPFGVGPRACIAPRFAILIIKIGIIYLLSNFDLCVGPKTQIPVRPKPFSCFFVAEKGLWIEMKTKKNRILNM